MGVRLRYTLAALRDIENIHNHIVIENPLAAERVRRSILQSVEILRDFPFIGRSGRRKGTREKTVARLPYLIVYRAAKNELTILRIYHGAQERPH
jgi:toxin ParE1/3/4